EDKTSKRQRPARVGRNRSFDDVDASGQGPGPAERPHLRAEAEVSRDEHRCFVDLAIHPEIRVVDLDVALVIRRPVVDDGPVSLDEDAGSPRAENGVVDECDLIAERQEIARVVRQERERGTGAQEDAVAERRTVAAVRTSRAARPMDACLRRVVRSVERGRNSRQRLHGEIQVAIDEDRAAKTAATSTAAAAEARSVGIGANPSDPSAEISDVGAALGIQAIRGSAAGTAAAAKGIAAVRKRHPGQIDAAAPATAAEPARTTMDGVIDVEGTGAGAASASASVAPIRGLSVDFVREIRHDHAAAATAAAVAAVAAGTKRVLEHRRYRALRRESVLSGASSSAAAGQRGPADRTTPTTASRVVAAVQAAPAGARGDRKAIAAASQPDGLIGAAIAQVRERADCGAGSKSPTATAAAAENVVGRQRDIAAVPTEPSAPSASG